MLRKKLYRRLALILSVIMLIVMIPESGLAEENGNADENTKDYQVSLVCGAGSVNTGDNIDITVRISGKAGEAVPAAAQIKFDYSGVRALSAKADENSASDNIKATFDDNDGSAVVSYLNNEQTFKEDGNYDIAVFSFKTEFEGSAKFRIKEAFIIKPGDLNEDENIEVKDEEISVEVSDKPVDADLKISDEAGLRSFAQEVNNGNSFENKHVELENDITLNGEWIPIGTTRDNPFKGSFDGKGCTVSGISITDTSHIDEERGYGFFGWLADRASIKNLKVAGEIRMDIDNESQSGSRSFYVGGIAGNYLTTGNTFDNKILHIVSCENYMDMYVPGRFSHVGGIIGHAYAKEILIKDSKNFGNIEIIHTHPQRVGGIAADLYIQAATFDGKPVLEDGRVLSCVNYGNIACKEVNISAGMQNSHGWCGGIVGCMNGYISECCNKGDIAGTMSGGGGIAGSTSAGAYINNCYNIGNIAQTAKNWKSMMVEIGGIFGGPGAFNPIHFGSVEIKNCYSSGTVSMHEDAMSVDINDITPYVKKTVINSFTAAQLEEFDKSERASKLGNSFKEDGYDMNGGFPLLKWEDTDTIVARSVSFELNPADALIRIYKDKEMTQEVEFSGTSGKLNPGLYYYKITAEGYYDKTGRFTVALTDKNISAALTQIAFVTINVLPKNTEFKLALQDDTYYRKPIEPVESGDGSYTFKLETGKIYHYLAFYREQSIRYEADFVATAGKVIDVKLDDNSILEAEELGYSTEVGGYPIRHGGKYRMTYGHKIVILTEEPVELVGRGIAEIEYYSTYIDCTSQPTNLTLKNVDLRNIKGKSGGGAGDSKPLINFSGAGNKLNIEGKCLLEKEGEGQGTYALIHVPHGSELTMGGSGTLYLYKWSGGSGIGGNKGEVNGDITFDMRGSAFMKGSKQGALIGAGAEAKGEDTPVPGYVKFKRGIYNLISNSRGAVIGGSAGGQGASAGTSVYVEKDANININVDYSGAAVGGGGYNGGNDSSGGTLYIDGGSLRTYIDKNAANNTSGWMGKPYTEGVNDAAITAKRLNSDGKEVYICAVDTSKLKKTNEYTVYLDEDDDYFYKGGVPEYGFVQEGLDKNEQLAITNTMSNWYKNGETKLYFYLTAENHKLTVNGEETVDVVWNAESESFIVTYNGNAGSEQLDAPVLVSDGAVITENGIKLKEAAPSAMDAAAKAVYRISDSNGESWSEWQESSEFKNLKADTVYLIQAKYLPSENSQYTESAASASLAIRTKKEGTNPGDTPEQPDPGQINVSGDAKWDGKSVDVSWYIGHESDSSYSISSAAKLAGAAALVNGLVNEECTVYTGNKAYSAEEWNTSEYIKKATGSSGGNNMSTANYSYGITDFRNKELRVTTDLDMSEGNYMPIGGQYLMKKNDSSTKIGSSFCGVFNGGQHTVNINCDRLCTTGNFGDGQSVGLIGRLGVHDNDPESLRPSGAAVKNVAVEGSVRANRSVGGIVGKIGKTAGGGSIENCANFAQISNTDSKGCGGIVGAGWNGGIIKNCYNSGRVSSSYACPTGGISGSNEVPIVNCYNIGKISAGNDRYAMAIGSNNGGASSVSNCWYLEASAPGGGYYSNNDTDNSGALSAEKMKSLEFVNTLGEAFKADTDNINNGYPVLVWQSGSGQQGNNNGTTVKTDQENKPVSDTNQSSALHIEKVAAAAKADEKGAVTAAVSVSDLEKAVSKLKSDADALISIDARVKADGDKAVTSAEVSMPALQINKIAAETKADLSVRTNVGNIIIANDDLLKLTNTKTENVNIVVKLKPAEVGEGMNIELKNGDTVINSIPLVLEMKLSDYRKLISEGGSNMGIVPYYTDNAGNRSLILYSKLDSDEKAMMLMPGSGSAVWVNNSGKFADVGSGNWYYDSVSFATSRELFKGLSDEEFAPDISMTRAMFVTVLSRLAGADKAAAGKSGFADVPEGKWYSAAVAWASENGIINGTGNGEFNPDGNVTREQMAAIMYRYEQKYGKTLKKSENPNKFRDSAQLDDWAVAAMQWATGNSVIKGNADGTLSPKNDSTRAEVATIMKNYISEVLNVKGYASADSLDTSADKASKVS